MKIKTFQVERWLNLYENDAKYELAETDAKAFLLAELSQLEPKENVLENMKKITLGYNPTSGSDALKELIAKLYGNQTSSKNILITTGAIEADFLLSNVLVQKDDQVIALWPAYQALYSTAEACGADLKFWKLQPENNFKPDLEMLSKMISHKTKLLILNIPNNPTGAVISKEQLETIMQWAELYDFYILCDEVYHELAFNKKQVPPYARSMHERAISVGSMSKAYGLSGLRLGWIAGPDNIITQCWEYKDYTSISNSPISDYLAQFALTHQEGIFKRNRSIVEKNKTILAQWFKENEKFFHSYLPEVGVLCFPKLINFPITSKQLALDLFHQKSLLVVPGECFGMPGHLRIGFGGDTEKFMKSLTIFSDYLQENF